MSKAYDYYTQYISIAETEEKKYEATLGALRSAYKLKNAENVYSMASKVINHPRATDDVRATANYYVATTALDNKSYDQALEAFNAIIRINSAELAAESRYQIANIYNLKGESAIAEKLAEETTRANVGFPFWVAKSLLLLSDIQFNRGDLLNARAILEAILENFQGDEAIVHEANDKLDKVKMEEENQSRIKSTVSDTLELQKPPKE